MEARVPQIRRAQGGAAMSSRRSILMAIAAAVVSAVAGAPARAADREAPWIWFANANAPGTVTINWYEVSEGVYGYMVQRRENDDWLDTTELPYTFASLTLTSLEPDRDYVLRVC